MGNFNPVNESSRRKKSMNQNLSSNQVVKIRNLMKTRVTGSITFKPESFYEKAKSNNWEADINMSKSPRCRNSVSKISKE
jgi:hypothetical protein